MYVNFVIGRLISDLTDLTGYSYRIRLDLVLKVLEGLAALMELDDMAISSSQERCK